MGAPIRAAGRSRSAWWGLGGGSRRRGPAIERQGPGVVGRGLGIEGPGDPGRPPVPAAPAARRRGAATRPIPASWMKGRSPKRPPGNAVARAWGCLRHGGVSDSRGVLSASARWDRAPAAHGWLERRPAGPAALRDGRLRWLRDSGGSWGRLTTRLRPGSRCPVTASRTWCAPNAPGLETRPAWPPPRRSLTGTCWTWPSSTCGSSASDCPRRWRDGRRPGALSGPGTRPTSQSPLPRSVTSIAPGAAGLSGGGAAGAAGGSSRAGDPWTTRPRRASQA